MYAVQYYQPKNSGPTDIELPPINISRQNSLCQLTMDLARYAKFLSRNAAEYQTRRLTQNLSVRL